jgi:apolipoprotein N-acyltransferase
MPILDDLLTLGMNGIANIEPNAMDINELKSAGSPLVVGVPALARGEKEAYYNSAVLFGEDGRVIDRYDKLHLVPFGEYIPLKPVFSFVEKIAPIAIGDFSAGTKWTLFGFFIERESKGEDATWRLLKKVRFSTLICFEDIFPELAREFVRRGALFLVNMTNDAWFGNTNAAHQHAQASVFRAVENRVNVVRAANTGVSCFIDQKGIITAKVAQDGKDIFVDGFRTHNIVLTKTRTFYAVHGDVFAYFCILAALAFLARTTLLRKLFP